MYCFDLFLKYRHHYSFTPALVYLLLQTYERRGNADE